MSREPDADEFDAIVSGWRSEGQVPEWPDGDPADKDPTEGPVADGTPPASVPLAVFAPPPVVRPYPGEPAEEHFVPPEPPPLPRPGPPALVGMGLLALGVVLLVAPSWIGVPETYGLPLGLVGLAAGLGWLVLRLWPDSPSGDGQHHDSGDDGAVL